MAGPTVPAGRHRRVDGRRKRPRPQGLQPVRAGDQGRGRGAAGGRCQGRVTDEDAQVAQLLRALDVPVHVLANKVDDTSHEALIWELMSLGLGEPLPISALHGRGTGDLLDVIIAELPEVPDDDVEQSDMDEGEGVISVALVGRPNVGKSTCSTV